MSEPLVVTAPGKLFLLGEYAVLDGAPALLTAVDRRVQVRASASSDLYWHLRAPDLGLSHVRLAADGTLPAGLDDDTRAKLAVFDAVRAQIADGRDTLPLPALDIEIDSGDFAHDGHKLGLGSSAAVAAALTGTLARLAGLPLDRAAVAANAIAAHRRAQNGTGSGGDVAASVYGGLISYRQEHAPTPLQWPPGLVGMAVITGQGARTPDLVARVRAYEKRDHYGYRSDISRLSMLADMAQQALTTAPRFLQLAREYHEALVALDRHAHAGIVTQRHNELHALAARHGAVFKTSGAGGGDVGLAFARSEQDARALQEAFARLDAPVVPLQFGADGMRVESCAATAVRPAG